MFNFNAENIFDFLFMSVVLLFVFIKFCNFISKNIAKSFDDEPAFYYEDYYLFTNKEGEKYLVPTNLDYEKQLSPEQTKWMFENYNYDIMEGLGDIPQVWFYEETSGMPKEKKLKILNIIKKIICILGCISIVSFLFYLHFMITP